MLQQVSKPLSPDSIGVGLPSGNRLDVLRVDQEYFTRVFQEVIDRLPIDPGAFNDRVDAALTGQPMQHPYEALGCSAKAAGLLSASIAIFDVMRQAVTLFLGTSEPAHRSYSTCMLSLLDLGRPGGAQEA